MLALLVSALVALYLLGPDLVSRWILAFAVPRRNIVQSRGEEITRAILWAAIPLTIAIMWAKATGVLNRPGDAATLENVFSGLYSDKFFEANRPDFFLSLHNFFWLNLELLWRLYAVVLAIALVFNLLILRFNRLWHLYRNRFMQRFVRFFLTYIILPRISEWHVLLSQMRLPPGPFVLSADLLTRANVLYQGRIQDKMLNPDGSLHAITLASPRRFLRDEFHLAQAAKPEIESSDYWKSIPGNLFVIMGSDIVNLNLKYVPLKSHSFKRTPADAELLARIFERLEGPVSD